MTGVPVTERLVAVKLTAVAPVPVTVMLPVPKASVLAEADVSWYDEHVKVLLLRVTLVSADKTKLPEVVSASARVMVLLTPVLEICIGKVLPLDVMV